MLAATAAVLGLLLLVVYLWPAPSSPEPSDLPFSDVASDRIQIEDVRPTQQTQALTPPPPAPLPPIVVPNDRLIKKEFEMDDGPLPIENPGTDARRQEGTTGIPTAARTPDTNARLLRLVQPSYPKAAQQAGVRARVRLSVEVDARGQVVAASITDRWVLTEDGRAEPTPRLSYGLEEAALSAARQSRFRPAVHNGQPVATRTTLTITFGN